MPTMLLTIVPLIQGALAVLSAFKGSDSMVKTTTNVNEAIGVITSLSPLLENMRSGQTVTPDDVRAALAGKDAALAAFDAAIAAKS